MTLTRAANEPRILYHDKFDGRGFTDQNSLANAMLTKPDTINPVITHLQGKEDAKFPLTHLTEGQKGGVRTVAINDIQYDWNTFEKLRRADRVKSHTYVTGDKPGLNTTEFFVVFETNWIKQQHMVVSPNGVQARVMGKPTLKNGGYEYRMRLINPSPTAYVDFATELVAGAQWSMLGGAPVSESLSMGNESNVVMPGKMKNQISILRKSYHLGGNIANKTVEVKFNINGKKTNYWMPFEEWQHMLNWKQDVEEHLWYSEYNRLPNGQIPLKDDDSGLEIPIGAGIFQQIPNKDTYSILTAKKIKTTVADVMYGATDSGNMNIVLYTGEGGAEEFDRAMKDEASGFSLVSGSNVGDKFVGGSSLSRNLIFGGYFTTYQHVDGHTVTIKRLPLFDYGGRAENSPKHPETGKPLESYRMVFLDQSIYDGEQNVKMVTQKGRAMIRGIVKGMAPTPSMDFGGNNLAIASEQDKCSIHYLCAKGVCIRRNTHCFELICDRAA